MNFRFKIIIPARYASTRLPGKPLLEIQGKPLLLHVFESASRSRAERIIIATDDERIQKEAMAFGAEVVMTSNQHNSGTDRLAEVVALLDEPDDGIVVNLQGDELGMPASLIDQVAAALHTNPERSMATLCEPITDNTEYLDPNIVKVVVDNRNTALYFSRSPIPGSRQGGVPVGACRHIGLYAYRCGFLKRISKMPVCALEEVESLEQLRVLFNGLEILVEYACDHPGSGIDTQDDLEKARNLFT